MRLPKDLLSGDYIKPRIFLCECDKTRICQLETTNTNAVLKFNSYSELTFEVGRVYNNPVSGETLVNPYYDKIEAFRLIEVDGLGYFEIQGPELVSDGIKEYKNITAYSSEYILSTKFLSDLMINTGETGSIEVTEAENRGDINAIHPVTLYNKTDTALSLLHIVLQDVYGWKIGHVDTSISTLSRSFDIDRESVYDFLMNEVCEKFNCYIVFDTINNTINVYAESLTSKFIGDGIVNEFTISPPFVEVGTVSVDGYKTTQWHYDNKSGLLTLDDIPADGAHIEVVDGALTEWETDVFVSFENLSNEMNINYDADAIKTKLTVTYGEDGDIRETNLGSPYLIDISYFNTVDWMGQDLYNAYKAYTQLCNKRQPKYTENSQEILKLNDQIYYEDTRLSLEYSLAQNVDTTTVGTYYVKQEGAGNVYYKEVSLPDEYRAGVYYYSDAIVNVTYDKVSSLYSALKKYFNNENTDDSSGSKPITSWLTDIQKLESDFKFVETKFNNLINKLQSVTTNRIKNTTVATQVKTFLSALWSELGRTPLKKLYLAPFQQIRDINIQDGWSLESSANYTYYYPVTLVIETLESTIKERETTIANIENKTKEYSSANESISKELALDNKKNFTSEQLIRLNAFLREDELHIDDIVETDQDNLSSSFKVKQDAMESGRIELQKLSQPQLQFSMTMANIYALPEFEPIIGQFQLGNVIRVALRPDYIKQSRLLQVDINFDDFSQFSCEFGELTSLRSQSDIHADLLKNTITAGKSVATNSSRWTRGSDTATSVDLQIKQGLLDSVTQIKAMDGTQGVVIDKYGIKLQKLLNPDTGELDPKQGWIVNNQFLFSDDGFKTAKSVFGEYNYGDQSYYGILAEAVVGSLIIGSQIRLANNDSSMTFDDSGLSVWNDTHTFNLNPGDTQSIISLSKKNDNKKIFYIDGDGSLNVTGAITATRLTLDGCTISADKVDGLSTQLDNLLDSKNVMKTGDVTVTTSTTNGITTTTTKVNGQTYTTYTSSSSNYLLTNVGTGTASTDHSTSYFKVATDGLLTAHNALIYGTVYASGGEIGGWTIGAASLKYGVGVGASGSLYLCPGGSKTEVKIGGSAKINGWGITVGSTFGVTTGGALYATGATISGEITATSGTIGGCSISDGVLKINSANINSLAVSKISAGTNANAVKFTNIEASGGTIAGWNIDSSIIYKNYHNETDNVTYSAAIRAATGTQSNAFAVYQKAGNHENEKPYVSKQNDDDTPWSYKFRVSYSGKLVAKDAEITGKITATSLTLDGCNVPWDNIGDKPDFANIYMSKTGAITRGTVAEGSNGIKISTAGLLEASNAVIYGKLYSSEGTIGGWTIGTTSLKYGGVVGESGSLHLCPGGTASKAKIGGSSSISGWSIAVGSGFGVTNDGKLYANSATIDGVLTCDVGSSVGGFKTDSNSLFKGTWGTSSTPTVFMCTGSTGTQTLGGHSGTGWCFGAGTKFGVNKDGELYASGGKIGGWNIGSSALYSTGTGYSTYIDGEAIQHTYSGKNYGTVLWSSIISGSTGSDIRLKHDVCKIHNKYDEFFDTLRPITFYYNEDACCGSHDELHFGFVAQDIMSAQQNLGLNDLSIVQDGEYYQIVRQELIALNTWQIQKAKARITDLEERVSQLEQLLREKGEN